MYSEIEAEEFETGNSRFGISTSAELLKSSSIIDVFDTVVFDLSQAVVAGNYVSFPVSVLSDDTVNSLDFSFKYNQLKLLYDSIYDLTNYLQSLSYYNASDSTVRFTSNSFQRYTNDTSLVLVSFVLLSGNIVNTDLNDISAYLNGELCSVKVINSLPTEILENVNQDEIIFVYPNPASGILFVALNNKATIQLMDLNGNVVFSKEYVSGNQILEINIQDISNGIYLLKVTGDDSLALKKIIIKK